MGIITQNSRMSHHTIYGINGITFSVPTSEDFTDGSWTMYDLCLSEIAVAEDDGKVYIRIGDEIKQFQMIGASGSISLSLSEVLTAGNTTNGNNIIMASASFITSASGERFLNIGDEYVYLHAEDSTYNTDLKIFPDRILVDSTKGIEYAGDYSASFTTYSLVDKAYVDGHAGTGAQTLEEVLTLGNNSGTQSIIMGTGTSISSSNGAGRLSLDYGSTINEVSLDSIWGSNSTIFSLDGYNMNLFSSDSVYTSRFDMTPDYLDISATDGFTTNRFKLGTSSVDITTDNGLGLQYTADYSSTFTDRSIIDKAYVDVAVAGVVGATGPQGLPGLNGADGIDGATGPAGPQGATGANGVDGTSGTSGISGTSGTSGTSGINGVNGTSGTSGINGVNGTSGTSGINGMIGATGPSGDLTATLEKVLTNGNTTGTHSILVESGYGIKHNTDNTLMVEYGNDGTFDYVSVGDTTSSTFRIRKDWDWRIDQTLGTLNTSISSTLGDGTIDILATDGTTDASISVQAAGDIAITGLMSNVLEYKNDNTTLGLFTTYSLVDKAYVDSSFTNVINGLTFSTGDIKLGGSLIESTTIETSAFDFKLINSTTQPILNSIVNAKGGEINVGLGVDSHPGDNIADIINNRDKAEEVNVFSRAYTNIGQAPFPYTSTDPISYTTYGNGLISNISTDGTNTITHDLDAPSGYSNIIATDGTNTITQTIKPTSFSLLGIPAYDDDAAASSAGLITGNLYQTTGGGAAPLDAAGILMIKQ